MEASSPSAQAVHLWGLVIAARTPHQFALPSGVQLISTPHIATVCLICVVSAGCQPEAAVFSAVLLWPCLPSDYRELVAQAGRPIRRR